MKNTTSCSPVSYNGVFNVERKFLFPDNCCRRMGIFWPFSLCCFYARTSFSSNFSLNRFCEAAGWPKSPQQAEEKCWCQQLCNSLRQPSSALSSQSVRRAVWEPIAAHLHCLIGRKLSNCYRSTTPRVQRRNQTGGQVKWLYIAGTCF